MIDLGKPINRYISFAYVDWSQRMERFRMVQSYQLNWTREALPKSTRVAITKGIYAGGRLHSVSHVVESIVNHLRRVEWNID